MLIGSSAMAEVWKVTRQWTDATEIEYANWFAKNATADFFNNPDKILRGKVPVDCAKAAFIFRAVFAAEKGLPFRYVTTRGDLVDQENVSPKTNDPQTNLIQFAKRVGAETSSLTFEYNSFPIGISNRNVRAGDVYVFEVPYEKSTAGRNHVENVKGLMQSGAVKWIWATVPAATRMLTERIQFPVFMPVAPSLQNPWGFRRLFQPQDYDLLFAARAAAKKQGAQSAEAQAAQQALVSAISRRGYSGDDQQTIAQAALQQYKVEYAAYAQENKLDISGLNLDNLNFDFILPVVKGARNVPVKQLPALPVSSRTRMNSNISDPLNPAVSFINIYQRILAQRLGNGKRESITERAIRDRRNLCYYGLERVTFVEEGYDYFANIARIIRAPYQFNRCPSELESLNYTTPNRDAEFRQWYNGTKSWYFGAVEKGSQITNRDQLYRSNISLYEMYELIFNRNPNLTPAQIKRVQKRLDEEPIDIDASQKCLLLIPMHDRNNTVYQMHIWEVAALLDKANEVDARALKEKKDLADVLSPWPFVPIERRWGLREATKTEQEMEANPRCEVKAASASKE